MTAPDRTQRPGARRYTCVGIAVTHEAARCLHAAERVKGLPQVFDANRRSRITPGDTPAERIADVVRRCPSGALQYHRADGGPGEEPTVLTPAVVDADGVLSAPTAGPRP